MTTEQQCPDPSRLEQMLAGGLCEDQQAELAAHLENCEECQAKFEALAVEVERGKRQRRK